VLLLGACAPRPRAEPPALGLDGAAVYAAYLAGQPPHAKLRHQVESDYGQEHVVIEGFLVLERPERFFVHARSPLGPALFEVKSIAGQLSVQVYIDQLKDQALARYLARDIERIYLTDCPTTTAVEPEGRGFRLRCTLPVSGAAGAEADDGLVMRLGPGAEVREKTFYRGEQAAAVVSYEDYREVGGRYLAHRIVLAQPLLSYRLSIVLEAADLDFDPSRLFGAPAGPPS
jgi:hypothetical protein